MDCIRHDGACPVHRVLPMIVPLTLTNPHGRLPFHSLLIHCFFLAFFVLSIHPSIIAQCLLTVVEPFRQEVEWKALGKYDSPR